MTDALNHIRTFHAELTDIRRDIHANPELGLEEFRTADLVARKLEAWGIETHRGIGGTGVITIGQILAVAAHIEGKAATVLDMSGLAQKFGPVMSHVRIGRSQDELHAVRVGTGTADLVLGCDIVVTTSNVTAHLAGALAKQAVVVVPMGKFSGFAGVLALLK